MRLQQLSKTFRECTGILVILVPANTYITMIKKIFKIFPKQRKEKEILDP